MTTLMTTFLMHFLYFLILLGLFYILKVFLLLLVCFLTHFTFTGDDQEKVTVYSRVLDLRGKLSEKSDGMGEDFEDMGDLYIDKCHDLGRNPSPAKILEYTKLGEE